MGEFMLWKQGSSFTYNRINGKSSNNYNLYCLVISPATLCFIAQKGSDYISGYMSVSN